MLNLRTSQVFFCHIVITGIRRFQKKIQRQIKVPVVVFDPTISGLIIHCSTSQLRKMQKISQLTLVNVPIDFLDLDDLTRISRPWVLLIELIEHCTRKPELTGSNPTGGNFWLLLDFFWKPLMPTFKMLPTLFNLRKLERLQKKIVTIEEFHVITGLCNRIHFCAITIAFLSCKLLNTLIMQ